MGKNQKLSDMELDVMEANAATKSPEKEVQQLEEFQKEFKKAMKIAGYDPSKDLESQILDSETEIDAMEQVAHETIKDSFVEAKEELVSDVRQATKPEMDGLEDLHHDEVKDGTKDARKFNEDLNKQLMDMKKENEILKAKNEALKAMQDVTLGTAAKNTANHIKASVVEAAKRGKDFAIEKVDKVKKNAQKFAENIKKLPAKTEKPVLEAIMQCSKDLRLIVANYNHQLGEQQLDQIIDLNKELEARKATIKSIEAKYDAKRDKKIHRMERIFGSRVAARYAKSITERTEKAKGRDPQLNIDKMIVNRLEKNLQKLEKKQNQSIIREAKYNEFSKFQNKLQSRINTLDKKLAPVKEAAKDIVKEQVRVGRDDACR